MCVAMCNNGIWLILLVVIHRIVEEQSETTRLGEISITIGFNQMVNQLLILRV